MPFPDFWQFSKVEMAELAILVVGTITLLVWALKLSVSGKWLAAMKLPPPSVIGLSGADLLLVVVIFLFMPSFVLSLVSQFRPVDAASQPASASAPLTRETESTEPAVGADEVAPHDSALMVSVNAVAQVASIIAILAVVFSRLRPDVRRWGLTFDRFPARSGQALVAYVVVWPVCAGLLQLSVFVLILLGMQEDIRQHSAIVLLEESSDLWVKGMTVISAVVLAPIVEELVFRGVLFRGLADQLQSTWSAAVISGVAFGLIHFSTLQTVPPLIFFGVVLAVLYARTESLMLPILLHAIFNGKTVLWLVLGGAP